MELVTSPWGRRGTGGGLEEEGGGGRCAVIALAFLASQTAVLFTLYIWGPQLVVSTDHFGSKMVWGDQFRKTKLVRGEGGTGHISKVSALASTSARCDHC